MYFDGGNKANLYCILTDRCKKFDNRFGLLNHLKEHWVPRRYYTQAASIESVSLLWSVDGARGPHFASGLLRRNRSNWLKTGPVRNEIGGTPEYEIHLSDDKFVGSLAFLIDITKHLNNFQLQKNNISQCFAHVEGFDKTLVFLRLT